MGCDIHMKVERKVGDQWLYVGNVDVWRSYSLFSLLADVRSRGDVVPLSAPRGVPADCSPQWKEYVGDWEGDIHSCSYFVLSEIIDEDFAPDEAFTEVLQGLLKAVDPDPTKLRIVFGFDN